MLKGGVSKLGETLPSSVPQIPDSELSPQVEKLRDGYVGLSKRIVELEEEKKELLEKQKELIDTLVQQDEDHLLNLTCNIVTGMAISSEMKDNETSEHNKRIGELAGDLSQALLLAGMYKDEIDDLYIKLIRAKAQLHDMGKVGISGIILKKHGKLSNEEFNEIKKHTSIGHKKLEDFEKRSGNISLGMAKDIVRHHHEKVNGEGYPDGLKGDEIPLSARIVAIVDAFDALCSRRPYKPALPLEEVMSIMKRTSGSHFDATIFKIFYKGRKYFFNKRKRLLSEEEEAWEKEDLKDDNWKKTFNKK